MGCSYFVTVMTVLPPHCVKHVFSLLCSLPHVQYIAQVEQEEDSVQNERDSRHARTRPSTASRFRAMVAEARQL